MCQDTQTLYKDHQLLDGGTALEQCGFTSETGWPQDPATVKLPFQGIELDRPCAWSPTLIDLCCPCNDTIGLREQSGGTAVQ